MGSGDFNFMHLRYFEVKNFVFWGAVVSISNDTHRCFQINLTSFLCIKNILQT